MYLWDKAIERTRKATAEFQVADTTDFFEMLRRSLLAKCSLMREYPYLYSFSVKAFYEQEEAIKESIRNSFQAASSRSETIVLNTINFSVFRNDIDVSLLYQELLWVSDGYLREMTNSGTLDPDRIENDYLRMIEQWKKVYLK